jgi:hypothetical protein
MGLARVLSLCPLLITIDDAARSLTLSICQIRSQRTCRLGVACACVCVREREVAGKLLPSRMLF